MPRAEPVSAPPQPPPPQPPRFQRAVYQPASYSVPPVQPYRIPAPEPVEPSYAAPAAEGNPVGRALVTLLLILLLVLVPLVSGYVVYKRTVGQRLLPISFSAGPVAAAPADATNR
jgi:hypothetical protein